MSAIILIKNNLPPSLSSLLFPLRSFTVFLSLSAQTLHVIDALCILLLASYVQLPEFIVSHLNYIDWVLLMNLIFFG